MSDEKMSSKDEMVDSPPHYTSLDPEPIKVIEAWDLGFHASTALKYLARYKRKGEPVRDLRKAAWYCNRLADLLEEQGK